MYRGKTYQLEINSFKKWMLQKRYSVNTINTYSALLLIFFRAIRKDIIAISQNDIILFNPLAEPFKTPYSFKASIKYSEQVGKYLQLFPKKGEINNL